MGSVSALLNKYVYIPHCGGIIGNHWRIRRTEGNMKTYREIFRKTKKGKERDER
jgi:hypothetical protein